MIYKVWVCLEAEYDDIEADSEDEAFQIACEIAIAGRGSSWEWEARKTEEGK